MMRLIRFGAVLAHEFADGTERPSAYASKTLFETEKKYGQVEKEALACVFAVKKFHCYIHGRTFVMCTDDHKPLVSVFNASRPISTYSSARIQRWALALGAYEFEIHYKPADSHGNAYALSRVPLTTIPNSTQLPPELILLVNHIAQLTLSLLNKSGIGPRLIRFYPLSSNMLCQVGQTLVPVKN